ncbi:MAG TPA: hypothetical protein VNS08_08500 [Ureibacillus sp.]|nr:hypothetical protein [Ureibacillus sp.]
MENNPYYDLSLEELAGFYYHLNINIEKGILSKSMYQEVQLIEEAAKKRGLPLSWLYHKGSITK